MDVSASMTEDIMLDLFCPNIMKDKTLIWLPGKSSSLENCKNLELKKKDGGSIALEVVAFTL